MRTLQRWAIVGLGAWLAGAGLTCGGKAVVDGFPGEGGGTTSSGTATGHTSGTTTTTTGGTPTGTVTGTVTGTPTGTVTGTVTGTPTGSASYCYPVCDVIEQCGAHSDCATDCYYSAPWCETQREAWLSCLLGGLTPGECDPPNGCADEASSWQACAIDYSSSEGCWAGSDGSCGCSAEISGGFGWHYETSCQHYGGTSQCRCTIDDQDAGYCYQTGNTMDACEVLTGCCSVLFFVPFGPYPED